MMIEHLFRPKLDKVIILCGDELNKMKSQFKLARGNLKSELYIIEITKILRRFISDVTEIVINKLLEVKRNKNTLMSKKYIKNIISFYKNVVEDFVFKACLTHVKTGDNPVNSFKIACELQKQELTDAINDGIKNIQVDLDNYRKGQWHKLFFNLVMKICSTVFVKILVSVGVICTVLIFYFKSHLKDIFIKS